MKESMRRVRRILFWSFIDLQKGVTVIVF